MSVERRANSGEIRAISDSGSKRIAGYGAVFNSPSLPIGGLMRGAFTEWIAVGAFTACLAGNPDIRFLWQHDASSVLGRTVSGTLKLATDNTGLRYECVLPSSTLGDNVFASVARRDVTGSSIGFEVQEDEWPDKASRVLRSVNLMEISAVTFPAYTSTTCAVRSMNGVTETSPLGWYRTGKLRLPLVGEKAMRQRVKELREETDGADGEPDDCDCECAACQNDDCENCVCDMTECTGTNCASDGSEDCHCFTTREAQGRMRRPAGKTIAPVDRIGELQRERELEQRLFDARQLMKLARR